MIKTPTLPAKAGYVEIIDENGEHVYEPTQETIDKQAQQTLIDELQTKLDEANKVIDTMIGLSANKTVEEEVAE
nr:MAG TPA: hypothetical protein [Caudoviricetes sp.]